MTERGKYKVTIGLEVHAELKTKTKMFCRSKNDPDETRPNVNVCPVCMAHPGTLPVINHKAVESVVKVGLAINDGVENIANFTEWDRKNYFYPDIPKGYQISQYKYPIVGGGKLAGVDITRIHLEEDTGTNKHGEGYSLVDFNRAGVPLMELVTEPVIHSAKEAGDFARELQLLLRTLGVSDANMEKGEMRVELNLSVSDTDKFGTKVEVKNINSFRAVEKAAEYEIDRHIKLIEEGRANEIVQETRGWDENKEVTFSQRTKENSEDYRYFPEPDLPKMYLHEVFDLEKMKSELPELPQEKRQRYERDYGIKKEDIELFVLNPYFSYFYEEVLKNFKDRNDFKKYAQKTANYILTYVGSIKFESKEAMSAALSLFNIKKFAKIIEMIMTNQVNSSAADTLFYFLFQNTDDKNWDPEKIAEEKGLIQQSDEGAIKEIVQNVINANEKVVADYKSGNENSLKFLMGQVMKESKGSANPQVATKILKELLD